MGIGQTGGAQCPNGKQGSSALAAAEARLFGNSGLDDRRAIFRAIMCKDVAQVDALLTRGIDPNLSVADTGLTTWAARAGFIPVLELLLQRGGRIDGEEGSFARSPLLGAIDYAIETSDWGVYEYLLSAGANPEIRGGNPTLTIAGHLAMINQSGRIIDLLDQGYDTDLCELRHWVQTANRPSAGKNLEDWNALLARLNSMLEEKNEKCER